MNIKNNTDRLHFCYRCDHPNFKKYVDYLYDKITDYYKDTNKFKGIRKDYIESKKTHISGIMLHLLMSSLNNKKINYPRKKDAYIKPKNSKKSRYRSLKGFSYNYTMAIIDYLEETKMINNYIGDKYKNTESIMTATNKMISEIKNLNISKPYLFKELVVLKASKKTNKNKPRLEYSDDKITNKIREEIEFINTELTKYKFNLIWDFDEENNKKLWKDFKVFFRNKYKYNWNDLFYDKMRYHRSFSDNFNLGGRWYGIWPQDHCPKHLRKYICIDDNRSVELDFKSIHPSILFSMENLDIPEDCYQLDNYDISDRPIIKNALMRMLNSDSRINALNSLRNEFNKGELGYTENVPTCENKHLNPILDDLFIKHESISKYFYSDIGKFLQYKDSELAKSIMFSLFKINIPNICIHDSFIVRKFDKDLVKGIMVEEFENMFGKKIFVK